MSILQKHFPFVKDQIEFQAKMAKRFSDNPFRVNLHSESKQKFESLASDLEDVDRLLDQGGESTPLAKSASTLVRLNLVPEDLVGLPADVLSELSVSDGDKTEFAILGLIEDGGGFISLDKLIVGLFRKTGEKIKRTALTSRLYRMGQKDMVFPVPGKKGVYSNRAVSEEEVAQLFG